MLDSNAPNGAVFRLLELIGLLLPVVAILVQVSINTYHDQEDGIRPGVRFSTLLLLIAGVLVLFVSAHELAGHLEEAGYGFAPAVLTALTFIEVGLALIGVSVIFLASPLLLRAGTELAVSALVVVPDREQRRRAGRQLSETLSVSERVGLDETADSDPESQADENSPGGGDSE